MLIVIAGSPGVGKTTLAKQLSNHLQVFFNQIVINIEIDSVRSFILGDSQHYNEKNSIWFELVMAMIEQTRKHPSIVIVEGLFHDKECLDTLVDIDPKGSFILLKTSLNNCLKRNNSRNKILSDNEVTELYELARPSYLHEISSDDTVENTLLKTLEFLNIDTCNVIAEN